MAAGQVILDKTMAMVQTEEDALELAVRQHARLVYRIAYSVLRNHHDAEDATQETFVKVLRSRRKLSNVDDPKAWLSRIAWRVACSKRKRVAEPGFDEAVVQLRSQEHAADDKMFSAELADLLQRLIQRLPRKLREPLLLSTLEEMSMPDIATTLDMSEAAVRSRIFRARHVLRERLTGLLEGKHES